MSVTHTSDAASGAKLLVLLLAFAWGFNWIAAAFALQEVPPWSLRFVGTAIGAATLVLATWLSGRSLKVRPGAFKHILIAGFFNVSVFNICSAFAQLYGAASRAVIITYSMPIWASVLAWLILGDKLDRVRLIALGLCIAGLTILVSPLFSAGATRCFLRVGLRLRLDDCHRLHEMGEGRGGPVGQCGVAASVRHAAAHIRHAAVRRLSAGMADLGARSLVNSFSSACSASASRISCGGRLSANCRPSLPRSARCSCRWSA